MSCWQNYGKNASQEVLKDNPGEGNSVLNRWDLLAKLEMTRNSSSNQRGSNGEEISYIYIYDTYTI